MNRFQVKLGHLSNYIRNFSPIKSIAIMERIVNHPILTIPQEGEHTFFIQWQTRNGNEGFYHRRRLTSGRLSSTQS